MATLSKQIFCLVLLVLFTYCQTEARQSLFFSKYVHLTANNNKNYVTLHGTGANKLELSSSTSPNPAPAPAPESQISDAPAGAVNYENAPAPVLSMSPDYEDAPASAPSMSLNYENVPAPAPMMGSNYENAPAPPPLDGGYAPAPLQSENWYYGLYAKGKSDFINDKEEEEFSNEGFNNGNGHVFISREGTNTYNSRYSDNLSNNNAFWASNDKIYDTNEGFDNINNGYKSEPQGMSDTRWMNNGKYYYNTQRENYDTNYNTNEGFDNINNGYNNKPQGMSDTRLMNNGKYFYNTERENYHPNGNELGRENENNEEYNGNYQRSKYEFDTMEEYEEEEGYAVVEQEFNNP